MTNKNDADAFNEIEINLDDLEYTGIVFKFKIDIQAFSIEQQDKDNTTDINNEPVVIPFSPSNNNVNISTSESNSDHDVSFPFEHMAIMFSSIDINTCEDTAMIEVFAVHLDQRKSK